jgi:hypothetical protein
MKTLFIIEKWKEDIIFSSIANMVEYLILKEYEDNYIDINENLNMIQLKSMITGDTETFFYKEINLFKS